MARRIVREPQAETTATAGGCKRYIVKRFIPLSLFASCLFYQLPRLGAPATWSLCDPRLLLVKLSAGLKAAATAARAEHWPNGGS